MSRVATRFGIIAGLMLAAAPAAAQLRLPSPPIPGPYPLMAVPMTAMAPADFGQAAASAQPPAFAPNANAPARRAMAMAVPYWMQPPAGVTTGAPGAPGSTATAGAPNGQAYQPGGGVQQPRYPDATTAQIVLPQAGAGAIAGQANTTDSGQPVAQQLPGFGQAATPGFFPTYRAAPMAPAGGYGIPTGPMAQPQQRFGAPAYVPQPYMTQRSGQSNSGGAGQ